ncbi:MAG TPA: RES family NAD+ phosphorylase [Longimicrobium sp.]
MNPIPLWRVFPWDPSAAEGERFSATYVPGGQGRSRFDLPGNALGVIYLAESEEHAVAEMIQGFRNSPHPLTDDDLTAWGHRLALAPVTLVDSAWPLISDLCNPGVLGALGIAADQPPLRDRRRTQAIAASLHRDGHAGLRWWSAFWGEWHTTVLFRDRLPEGALTYGPPVPLHTSNPHVLEAARLLDIG